MRNILSAWEGGHASDPITPIHKFTNRTWEARLAMDADKIKSVA